jgi:SAM-dependent methyltransferase
MNPFTPLAKRLEQEEEMDAADLPDERYARVLAHLSRVNLVTLAQRPTLAFVKQIMDLTRDGSRPLRLLDVGFGHGDMLRAIARLAGQRGRSVELVGVDLNPRSELAARAATDSALPIRWITGDYRDLAGQGWDMVISSLVAHHMSDGERIAFLRFMEVESRHGWLVNDLHRQRIPFAGYPLLASLLLVDPIVRRDGQLSVGRSFRAHEWQAMLAEAGIDGAKVHRWFPWRLCVEHIRQ